MQHIKVDDNQKNYKLLIFDMDGTIVDSRRFHALTFYRVFNQAGQSISYEQCYESVGQPVKKIFMAHGIRQDEFDHLFFLLDKVYKNEGQLLLPQTCLLDGTVPLLKAIRSKGIHVALLTNSLTTLAVNLLKYHKINHYFDIIVGAEENSNSKHERAETIQKKFGAMPHETLIIGDLETDLELAKDLEYDACFMKTEIAWFKDPEYINNCLRPRYTVKSVKQLFDILHLA